MPPRTRPQPPQPPEPASRVELGPPLSLEEMTRLEPLPEDTTAGEAWVRRNALPEDRGLWAAEEQEP